MAWMLIVPAITSLIYLFHVYIVFRWLYFDEEAPLGLAIWMGFSYPAHIFWEDLPFPTLLLLAVNLVFFVAGIGSLVL